MNFKKNDNMYGYDLIAYKYDIYNNGGFDKFLLGYIEIEISENWVNEYPDYWQDYSFCRRKIHVFNHVLNEFTNTLKDNAENTIYIIFNKSLTDCIANKCDYIANNFEIKKRNLTGKIYNDTFLTTAISNDNHVVKGIENTLNFIYMFLIKQKKCQLL